MYYINLLIRLLLITLLISNAIKEITYALIFIDPYQTFEYYALELMAIVTNKRYLKMWHLRRGNMDTNSGGNLLMYINTFCN